MTNITAGDNYNYLTFVSYSGSIGKSEKRRAGLFKCKCGNEKIISIGRVVGGYVLSCGCAKIDGWKRKEKHGMRQTREYRTWQSIRSRVLNANSKDFKKYSKLNNDLVFLDSFIDFYNEVGPKPIGDYSIDRIDNNSGYRKGNLRWATRRQQARNTKKGYIIIIKGKRYETLEKAAEYNKRSIQTIVRWCIGFYDKRRNTWTPKREWAEAIRRYTCVNKEQRLGKSCV